MTFEKIKSTKPKRTFEEHAEIVQKKRKLEERKFRMRANKHNETLDRFE